MLRPGATGNRLLDRLPAADAARLRGLCQPVRFDVREVAYRAGGPLDHVYFPLAGAFSILVVMADGTAVEVGTVGREGMLGAVTFLGADRSPFHTFCQVAGDALRLPRPLFRRETAAGRPLADLVRRFLQLQDVTAAQSAACNRLHGIEARCARWLLLTHDRVRADEFALTHEFLALMLGVRRASVTVAAGRLQDRGLIGYARGRISVRDRAGLEAAACECYRAVADADARAFA